MIHDSRSALLGGSALGLAALLVAGCVPGSSRLTVDESSAGGIQGYRHLAISATSPTGDTPEAVDFLAQLEGAVRRDVGALDRFERVTTSRSIGGSNSSAAKLELRILVTSSREVGDAARVWLGALAGRAGLDVGLELVDSASGRTLAAGTASGKSGANIFAGTTQEAVDSLAAEIARFVKSQTVQ